MALNSKITVELRSSYGNELFYPVDDNAKALAEICGVKTFTKGRLASLRAIGFEIECKQKSIEEILGT